MSRSDNDLFDTPADPFKHGKTDTIPPDAHIDHAAALAYWSSISPDVNGMLGGYPQISRIDLRGSANFLIKLRRRFGSDSDSALFPRGVDCGAGIGRVTKGFLAGVCELVDLVEPVERFAWEVEYGEEMTGLRHQGKIGKVYMTPLETWEPEPEMYHLIWNQWCLGHLTDTQLVAYLSRCAGALKKGGWVIIKENMSTDANKEDIYDPQDNSVTRADEKFRKLFDEAGLELMQTELQTGFPRSLGLYPVRFYALRPIGAGAREAKTTIT